MGRQEERPEKKLAEGWSRACVVELGTWEAGGVGDGGRGVWFAWLKVASGGWGGLRFFLAAFESSAERVTSGRRAESKP